MKNSKRTALTVEKRNILIFWGILIFIALSSINIRINNDFWFLTKSGQYVVEHGIPYTEPLTMHQGFDFVMQQWLSATIFYEIYSHFGLYGMVTLMAVMFAISVSIVYKICLYVSDNNIFVSFLLGILYCFVNVFSCVTRPQIFTIMMLLLELYLLERFVKEQNSKYLIGLPVISVFEINLHASMWWLIIVLMLPYVVDSISINFKKIKINGENKKRIPFFVSMIGVFLAGFINPYGLDAITYLFKSYGIQEINSLVGEMQGISVNKISGKYLLIVMLIIIFIYIFYRKGTSKIRYFFLTLGTTYLMLSAYRSIFIFAVGSIFPLAYYLKDALRDNEKYSQTIQDKKKVRILAGALCIVMVAGVGYKFASYDESVSEPQCKKAYDYLKENYNTDDVVPFSLYDDGGYAEYIGFRPYIDPRAEVFVKKNNGKADIMKEFSNVMNGNVYYKDVFDKYKFTHLIINKTGALKVLVSRDPDYRKIYSDKNRIIYEYVGPERNNTEENK